MLTSLKKLITRLRLAVSKENTQDYWNNYYRNSPVGGVPSQFAVFALSEFNNYDKVIDFGCGNGRDSFFFASQGKKVLAVDGSENVIKSCNAKVSASDMQDIAFTVLDFSDEKDCKRFFDAHAEAWADAIIYARFFVHAIDENEERNFLKLCQAFAARKGVICLEFRTDRDELQRKVTEAHYRRFVSPVKFIRTLQEHNLKVEYFCEGFGMAKYREDDAHVARFVLSSPC